MKSIKKYKHLLYLGLTSFLMSKLQLAFVLYLLNAAVLICLQSRHNVH